MLLCLTSSLVLSDVLWEARWFRPKSDFTFSSRKRVSGPTSLPRDITEMVPLPIFLVILFLQCVHTPNWCVRDH